MVLIPILAKALPRLFPGVTFATDILPTEWAAAPKRTKALRLRYRPDLVLHFGVSGRARGIEVERRGRNVCALAPDARGATPNDVTLDENGPALRPSRLPVAEIVARLRQRQVPAFQSWNAGTYLCNATLYDAVGAQTQRPEQVGFVHIPAALARPSHSDRQPVLRRAAPGCPLSWEQAILGSIEIIATCLDRPGPSQAAIRRVLTGRIGRG
jgi:pyroglutamyl-peptidase